MSKIDFRNKLVLITGGSSGIGLALAEQLATKGARVWIMAQNPEKLENALNLIRQRSDPAVTGQHGVLSADVTDPDAVHQAYLTLVEKAGIPDMVINSAGVAHPGYFQELSLEIFRWTMDVNYFGTLYVLKEVVPGMILRKSGTIVNISSMAGYVGVFGYSAYGASKYAVRGLSEVLRSEMKPHGIQVTLVYPPDTDTPQLAYESQFKPQETKAISENGGAMSADAVAKKILTGVAKGKFNINPSLEGKIIYHLNGIMGNTVNAVLDQIVASARRKMKKN